MSDSWRWSMRDTPVLVDYPCSGRRAADAESAAGDSLPRPNASPRAALRGARPRQLRSSVGQHCRVQRDRHRVRAKGYAGREPRVELQFPQAVERHGACRLWTQRRRDGGTTVIARRGNRSGRPFQEDVLDTRSGGGDDPWLVDRSTKLRSDPRTSSTGQRHAVRGGLGCN
jgi:hypothetical protein